VDRDLASAVERALGGDATAMDDISGADHGSLRAAGAAIGRPLIVTRDAIAGILRGLMDERIPPTVAQAWASFMRRGYIESSAASGPIEPIEIEFEEAWEDAISTAVSRLDEIGDLVDGEVTTGEAPIASAAPVPGVRLQISVR
jgi:hypothetical protein